MKSVKYIVENPKDALWGLSITTVGYECYEVGDPYPSKEHNSGYYFNPEKGRTLQEYQLCYITEGTGIFKSVSCPSCEIRSGMMFLLFPNEWHTYTPYKNSTWKQYWIGFKGINIDVRTENGFLKKESPLFNVGINDSIVSAFKQAIDAALNESPHFQILLAGITNYLLGLMFCLDQNERLKGSKSLIDKMNLARGWMHEDLEKPVSVRDIASRLGMSYSSFRKYFKDYSGVSPSRYLLDIRLQHAKALLRTTELPIKEIAYRLHFETSDYFSSLFHKKTGLSPSEFRNL
ncbi:MAG: helix-turn-helix domain-containing protein [Bacteroides sp.]|nr:helix-turn-helix domain-containing protein [Bacteroides sp.]